MRFQWMVGFLSLAFAGCGDGNQVFTTGTGATAGAAGTGGGGAAGASGTAGAAGSTGGTMGGSAGTGGTAGTGGAGPVTCNDGQCDQVLAGQCFTSYVCSAGGMCNGVDKIPGEDDSNACTHDNCNGTGWDHVALTADEIDDKDPCTDDSCNPNTGILHTKTCPDVPDCNTYCGLSVTNCTASTAQYTDQAECEEECAFMTVGALTDKVGFTVGCLQYWAGTPSSTDPTMNCKVAGPLSATCGTPCDNFCALAMSMCGALPIPPYASTDACLMACDGFAGLDVVPYNANVFTGNSLACRARQLARASHGLNVDVWCARAGIQSDSCQ